MRGTGADRLVVAMKPGNAGGAKGGGGPGRWALDAGAVGRDRRWQEDWVVDLDIRSFFDSVPWEPILKAVAHHTDERWIILYVQRWLEAPVQSEDASLSERDRGTPQGSAVSPLLANMFLHYAFDAIARRVAECGLELNEQKTRIAYCARTRPSP